MVEDWRSGRANAATVVSVPSDQGGTVKTPQKLGRWTRVTTRDYVEVGDALEVGVLISPYDIPDGIRGRYDDQNNRFVVEFRYMVDEKYRRVVSGDGVWIRLGKYSGRVVGVEVDRRTDPYTVIGEAIQNVHSITDARTRRRANYLVARKVLEDKRDDIFGNTNMHLLAEED